MPIMEIKIIPIGTATPSVSDQLVGAFEFLEEQKDVRCFPTAMGTLIEADNVQRLYELAGQLHQKALEDSERVVVFTEVDERLDKKLSIAGKIASMEAKMGEGYKPASSLFTAEVDEII